MKLEEVRLLLKQRIDRASTEDRVLDHILLCGPTELTQELIMYISSQAQIRPRRLAAAKIHLIGDLAAILANLQTGSIFSIDEIHCLEQAIIPVFSSAMQNLFIDLVVGKEPQAKNVRLNLPHFTVIATTTRPTLLSYQLHTLFHVEYEISP